MCVSTLFKSRRTFVLNANTVFLVWQNAPSGAQILTELELSHVEAHVRVLLGIC